MTAESFWMMFFADRIIIPFWYSQKPLRLLVNTRFSISFELHFVINFDQDSLIVLVFLFLIFSSNLLVGNVFRRLLWKQNKIQTQPSITYSKLTMETLEQVWNMFKVNNEDTRSTPLAYRSGVFIVNLEHISNLALVCLLLTLNM